MSERGGSSNYNSEDDLELRRGPWTIEEDTLLIHHIACHGEGRWNLLAKNSGLKRTGKSCRLRWLNYLKPDIKRGNLSPQEQLLILELHSKWGNRWSRIAQQLPGRTDNEIKNYWRTRVQKQARQLKIDVNSARFHDVVRCYWMPRLLEKIASNSDHHQEYYSCSIQTMASSNTSCSTHHPSITTTIDFQEDDQYNYCPFTLPNDLIIHSDQFESSSTRDQDYLSGSGGGNQINPYNPAGAGEAAAAVSAASDHTVTAINDCNDSSSSGDGGDVLWNIDELYDILKSYMKLAT